LESVEVENDSPPSRSKGGNNHIKAYVRKGKNMDNEPAREKSAYAEGGRVLWERKRAETLVLSRRTLARGKRK